MQSLISHWSNRRNTLLRRLWAANSLDLMYALGLSLFPHMTTNLGSTHTSTSSSHFDFGSTHISTYSSHNAYIHALSLVPSLALAPPLHPPVFNTQSLDFTLTFISVVFNYPSPFFLRRILEAIDDYTELEKQKRSQAYVYAALAFLCTVAKVGRVVYAYTIVVGSVYIIPPLSPSHASHSP